MVDQGRGLAPPRDLTIPEPGSTTAHRVLSRAIGRLLVEVGRVGPALLGAPGMRASGAEVAAFQRAVGLALKANVGAIASALRSPTAGVLLRCLRPDRAGGGAAREGLAEELMAAVGFELARAGALAAPLRLKRLPARVLSLSARVEVTLPEDASGLVLENGRAVIERGGGRAEALDLDRLAGAQVSRPYLPIEGEGGIVLALADNNPLAMVEAHPEKGGNAIDLGGRPAEAWIAALRGALATIERYLPDLRREMELFIHQIVPVGWDAERHLSASYQEAIGTIYLSLHPSPMTMAEALLHEFSHNKLNALFELDPVLENAWWPLYASPVRPDPRPLHGVLLAVHAFLPVARLYERMIEEGSAEAQSAAFTERFARIRRTNREGAEVVLAHARPTGVGAGLLEEIRRWDAYYARFDAAS